MYQKKKRDTCLPYAPTPLPTTRHYINHNNHFFADDKLSDEEDSDDDFRPFNRNGSKSRPKVNRMSDELDSEGSDVSKQEIMYSTVFMYFI